MEIRPARPDDLVRLTEIYNHYVLHSYATLDEHPSIVDERRGWLERFAPTGPYRLLVAEDGGTVLGYVSSGRYREHPSFRETIETSIYLAPEARGRGAGRALYDTLFTALKDEKLHLAVAGIALPNPASVGLHKAFGFREVGTFHEYAVKNGVRVSSVWMEKPLAR